VWDDPANSRHFGGSWPRGRGWLENFNGPISMASFLLPALMSRVHGFVRWPRPVWPSGLGVHLRAAVAWAERFAGVSWEIRSVRTAQRRRPAAGGVPLRLRLGGPHRLGCFGDSCRPAGRGPWLRRLFFFFRPDLRRRSPATTAWCIRRFQDLVAAESSEARPWRSIFLGDCICAEHRLWPAAGPARLSDLAGRRQCGYGWRGSGPALQKRFRAQLACGKQCWKFPAPLGGGWRSLAIISGPRFDDRRTFGRRDALGANTPFAFSLCVREFASNETGSDHRVSRALHTRQNGTFPRFPVLCVFGAARSDSLRGGFRMLKRHVLTVTGLLFRLWPCCRQRPTASAG